MIFENPQGKSYKISEIVTYIKDTIESHPYEVFKIIIGTDSQKKNSGVNFISVIVVYRVGKGGTYFIYRERIGGSIDIKRKIYKEAHLSLEVAQKVRRLLKNHIADESLELHVDIGEKGETRGFIKELVKYIEDKGFQTSIKPQSFAASKVADRFTK